jgi:DtxR family transcriptional regulator, Mn-dependent transcriptional regulator
MSESTDNYLKTIYALGTGERAFASTTDLAEKLCTKASSVTDMLKKLDEKGLVKHTKYYGTTLTAKGKKQALHIVRKHRLWEMFLVEKLGFGWNEVHDIAEQLEHVESAELIQKLDAFLNYPKYDPHGDPIPDTDGKMPAERKTTNALHMQADEWYEIVAVVDSSANFLTHLKQIKLALGSVITLKTKFAFDNSIQIISGTQKLHLSQEVAGNLLVQKTKKQ